MPSIRLVPVNQSHVISLDWLQTPTGLLDETQEFASAVTVALCTDALANLSDVLPDPRSTDRRGWWGDTNADAIWNGWPIGTRLWVMMRAKIIGPRSREGSTTARIDNHIREALQPFITQRLCSRISVDVQVVGLAKDQTERIIAKVTIYRGPKDAIQLQFQALWDEIDAVDNANP